VKSSSTGGFGFLSPGEENTKDYMNYPYSRTQDSLGASLATPATFFKGNHLLSNIGVMINRKGKDIIYQRRDFGYKKRPSTSGEAGQYGSLRGQAMNQTSSIIYFDR